jgi:hypothetical protein
VSSGQREEPLRRPLVSISPLNKPKLVGRFFRRGADQRRWFHRGRFSHYHLASPDPMIGRRRASPKSVRAAHRTTLCGVVRCGLPCLGSWVEARLCRWPLGLWPHEGAGHSGRWTLVRDTRSLDPLKHYASAPTAASEISVAHICARADVNNSAVARRPCSMEA